MPLKPAATLNGDVADGAAMDVGFVGETFGVCCVRSLSVWRSGPLRPDAGVVLAARVRSGPRWAYLWITRTVVDRDALAALVPSPATPMVDARMASVQMENSTRRGFNGPPFDET